jgi:toxin ParE1/3/4
LTPIVWTEQALADVTGIRDFIARDAPGYAEVIVDRIFESVERLQDFPQSGRVVPELGDDQIREVILGTYRIVYRPSASEVTIPRFSIPLGCFHPRFPVPNNRRVQLSQAVTSSRR